MGSCLWVHFPVARTGYASGFRGYGIAQPTNVRIFRGVPPDPGTIASLGRRAACCMPSLFRYLSGHAHRSACLPAYAAVGSSTRSFLTATNKCGRCGSCGGLVGGYRRCLEQHSGKSAFDRSRLRDDCRLFPKPGVDESIRTCQGETSGNHR